MEKTSVQSTEKRVAVVTGGNKGIGFEICRQLASNGILVILTARNEKRGTEAIEKLKTSGLVDVVFHQLDVKDPTSVVGLAKFVQSQFKKLDILVNNAGESGVTVQHDEYKAFRAKAELSIIQQNALHLSGIVDQSYDLGEACIRTNYYGTKIVSEAFLPLLHLSNSPRIVNISSYYGQLQWIHNEKVKAEFQDIDNLTEDKIDGTMEWFLRDLKANKLKENGWPFIFAAYKFSKAAINAYTRLLARKFPNALVNCVHPGYVTTDITFHMGDLTPEEGAKAPVMVALLPDGGPSGVYFNQMQISSF